MSVTSCCMLLLIIIVAVVPFHLCLLVGLALQSRVSLPLFLRSLKSLNYEEREREVKHGKGQKPFISTRWPDRLSLLIMMMMNARARTGSHVSYPLLGVQWLVIAWWHNQGIAKEHTIVGGGIGKAQSTTTTTWDKVESEILHHSPHSLTHTHSFRATEK